MLIALVISYNFYDHIQLQNDKNEVIKLKKKSFFFFSYYFSFL